MIMININIFDEFQRNWNFCKCEKVLCVASSPLDCMALTYPNTLISIYIPIRVYCEKLSSIQFCEHYQHSEPIVLITFSSEK